MKNDQELTNQLTNVMGIRKYQGLLLEQLPKGKFKILGKICNSMEEVDEEIKRSAKEFSKNIIK